MKETERTCKTLSQEAGARLDKAATLIVRRVVKD